MYSKPESSKSTDVRLSADKGSLRLQFSTRVSQMFYGKRQKYVGLGREDNPGNRKWAEKIIQEIQADIDYRYGENFDSTLSKYLALKNNIVVLPGIQPPILKKLWDELVQWKINSKQIKKSTLITNYEGNYKSLIAEYLDKPLSEELAQTIIQDLSSRQVNKDSVLNVFRALSKICQRAINEGKLHKDFFADIKASYKVPKKSQQLSEEDRRAYTVEERDIIIKAFYESNKPSARHLAPFFEFLFLTGCRHGEAVALKKKMSIY